MINKIVRMIICIIIPLSVGMLSGYLSRSAATDYTMLKMPPLSPPGAVFPVVWTILYILMGIGNYLIISSNRGSDFRWLAILSYILQLILNFLWSIVFFSGKNYMAALGILILMWLIIIFMMTCYSNISKLAMFITIPLLVWTTFAAYLNIGAWVMNK